MKGINQTNTLHQFMSALLDSAIKGNQDLAEKAVSCFNILNLKKFDYFVKENKVCQDFCFVESGILQHSILINDEEKTTYLALRNSVTTSLDSFLNQKPSRKTIKAIADCKLWVIDLPTFKNLIENNLAFHQFYYNLIEKQICLIDDYRIDLLTLTPEERYQKLLNLFPDITNRISLGNIASYLNITQETLSRIRNKH